VLKMPINPIRQFGEGGVKKILIFKWSALGDVILIVPSLRVIRRGFPRAEIYLLGKKEYKEFLHPLGYIDNFIEFPEQNWRHLIPKLRRENFDLSIDFQNTWRSHFLAFRAGAKNRLGYRRKGGRILLTIAVSGPEKVHPVEHQAWLLSKIGVSLDDFKLECAPPPKPSFQLRRPYIAILPGAGKGWDSKCWSELSFARLADILIKRLKYEVVFLGGKREKDKVGRIKKAMKEKGQDLAGQTNLIQLAGVIKESSAFISHDTGPMHLAQALEIPTIALFGPTDPRRHTVPAANLYIVKKELSCQPCYRKKCSHQQCMQLIEVEEILGKIKQILHING